MNKYKCRDADDGIEWDDINEIYKAFDEECAAGEFAEWYDDNCDGWKLRKGSPGDDYLEVEVLNLETGEEFIVQTYWDIIPIFSGGRSKRKDGK